jgi:primosomal protein N' (replication factor Y) (superfamily II helicase)
VEALVRWDPAWFADRELADRRELSLPPTVAMVAVTGERRAVEGALRQAELPAEVERLGPLPVRDDSVRVLLRVPLDHGPQLWRALAAMKAVRSARKEAAGIQVRVGPPDLAS